MSSKSNKSTPPNQSPQSPSDPQSPPDSLAPKEIVKVETVLEDSLDYESDLEAPSTILSQVKTLFDDIDKWNEWNNDTLPDELARFFEVEMKATKEHIRFSKQNFLSSIRTIASFGNTNIDIILDQFPPENCDNQHFITFLTSIHYLATFFKDIGVELKEKD